MFDMAYEKSKKVRQEKQEKRKMTSKNSGNIKTTKP